MISPEELEIKDLPKTVRGYSVPDTDSQIKYLCDKYCELYSEYQLLQQSYSVAVARLSEYENDEKTIRTALIDAQKASSKITTEANEKADLIVRSTKVSCDKILFDFRQTLHKEQEKLSAVAEATDDFKERLLELYREHMAQIGELTADESYKELLGDDASAVDSVISTIKDNVTKELDGMSEQEEEPEAVPVNSDPVPLDLDEAYERRNNEVIEQMLEKPDPKLFDEAKHDSEIANNPNMIVEN